MSGIVLGIPRTVNETVLPPAIIGIYLDNTLPTPTPHALPTLHQKFHYYENVCRSKLKGVAPLITDLDRLAPTLCPPLWKTNTVLRMV